MRAAVVEIMELLVISVLSRVVVATHGFGLRAGAAAVLEIRRLTTRHQTLIVLIRCPRTRVT
jgi:hypothetical protein